MTHEPWFCHKTIKFMPKPNLDTSSSIGMTKYFDKENIYSHIFIVITFIQFKDENIKPLFI